MTNTSKQFNNKPPQTPTNRPASLSEMYVYAEILAEKKSRTNNYSTFILFAL